MDSAAYFILPLVIAMAALGAAAIWWAWAMGQKQEEEFERGIDVVALQVSVPREQKKEDERKDFKELIAVAEPFLAAISSLYQRDFKYSWLGQEHVTFEIVAHSGEIWFICLVPRSLKNLFERQIHAQYPTAQIEETTDYGVFRTDEAAVAIGRLALKRKFVFPIRTYKELESDSLNAITNTLSKLPEGATAAIQYVVAPKNDRWRIPVAKVAKLIQKGKNPHASKFSLFWQKTAETVATTKKEEEQNSYQRLTPIQETQMKRLEEKGAKLGFDVEVKLVVTAGSQPEADTQLQNMFSAFGQFDNPEENAFRLSGSDRDELIAAFILKKAAKKSMILNTEELASIFHFPNRNVDTPNIHWLRARSLPPPTNLPAEGTIVGQSIYRGESKEVKITASDRLRHVYMIGKTGVGKTVLFENMVMQDIRSGQGVCYLDPNGDAIEYILNHLPADRAKDVILFEPADVDRPMGLNLLEASTTEEKDFLVQESIQIFYKLFDPGKTGIVGPQFEHWMRNAALTVMANPKGGTLIDIPRLFTDKAFEDENVKYVTDPVVKSFWQQQMAKTSDYHKSEMLNYFVSKFGRFMTNDMMRNIIGQPKSAFDFRAVMDGQKILLINLSKGLVGEINANLLGMIIVTKLQMAAFSRQDTPEEQRTPFYLYVDEFQNFTTDAFATILSEARKYKLALAVTNQYIAQLPEMIRDAVMGNAGTLIAARIGAADAEFMVKEFEPLTVDDMINIDKYNFYLKTLIDNAPTRPFNVRSLPPEPAEPGDLPAAIRQLSRLTYGRDKKIVDWEVRERTRILDILPEQTPAPAAAPVVPAQS